jgi:hypothetical protein
MTSTRIRSTEGSAIGPPIGGGPARGMTTRTVEKNCDTTVFRQSTIDLKFLRLAPPNQEIEDTGRVQPVAPKYDVINSSTHRDGANRAALLAGIAPDRRRTGTFVRLFANYSAPSGGRAFGSAF